MLRRYHFFLINSPKYFEVNYSFFVRWVIVNLKIRIRNILFYKFCKKMPFLPLHIQFVIINLTKCIK